VTGRVLLLIVGCLACWVLVALPARALLEDVEQARRVIAYSGVALLLCLVPAVATLCWARRSLDRSPQEVLAAVLGGTGIRLFATLLAAWALTQSVPFFGDGSFLYWLLGAYLFTLTLEMTLLLAGRPASAPKT
jgi:hypothetical protein